MRASQHFVVGQRWISETEPELGLGLVAEVGARTVTIDFPATRERRQYASDNAPVKRVRFKTGDALRTRDGKTLPITQLEERAGLITYGSGTERILEKDLADVLTTDRVEQRLRLGQVDPLETFELRAQALAHHHRMRKSPVRGFVGGRIALLPHQLYLAHEVSSRLAPRVLLADEVGLGKTIEACLILHRLLITGRASRVLILVPESLVHQWFVELFRKFNLRFSLFDEERCLAMEQTHPELNPFLDDQWVIASLAWLTGQTKRLQQALEATWDILVVDEAHHLAWTPDQVSPAYQAVAWLAARTQSVLLLTATPEQLGAGLRANRAVEYSEALCGHFARLRLLDPARYHDWQQFVAEAGHYKQAAQVASRLVDGQALSSEDRRLLTQWLAKDNPGFSSQLQRVLQGDLDARHEIINDLLDRHGTGRVMFRNTRAAMTGFPARKVHLVPLELKAGAPSSADQVRREFPFDLAPSPDRDGPWNFEDDPRIDWLVKLLRRLSAQKVLLICRSLKKVEAIEAALRGKLNVKIGQFHEKLTLLQRDRAAAWFAEEDGAQLLLCSEIGSEGRNFQFAHHLVLFDLPLDAELLEQRIGRLDRIGQTATIHIHVPCLLGSGQEALVRWYHEGLDAFRRTVHGGQRTVEQFGEALAKICAACPSSGGLQDLDELIFETKRFHKKLEAELAAGRDRLLELNSLRQPVAQKVVDQISALDAERTLEQFLLRILDHYTIHIEELAPRTYLFGAGDLITDAFPGLPAQGIVVTSDRAKALAREDIGFLSWDHPLVTGAVDSMLGSETGTACFAVWNSAGPPLLLLEARFVLEPVAPPELHIDRFLPPTPLRVLVDHQLRDLTESITSSMLSEQTKDAPIFPLLDQAELMENLLPRMIEACRGSAESARSLAIDSALEDMQHQLEHEINRLVALQSVNPNVRPEEIELAREQLTELQRHILAAPVRLDALRLVSREIKG